VPQVAAKELFAKPNNPKMTIINIINGFILDIFFSLKLKTALFKL